MSASGPLESRLRNTICIPIDSDLGRRADDLPSTSTTLHRLFIIVGGVCMVVAGILSLFNFLSHLVWRRNLAEQKHLMRLIILPFMFAIFSWWSILIYGVGLYLDPIPRLYEAYCICTFFNLMVQVLHPDERTRTEFFVQADRSQTKRKQTKQIHGRGSYRWYRYNHMIVHLVPAVLLILTIVEEVLTYQHCSDDEDPSTASTAAFQVLEIVLTVTPLISLLRLYSRFQSEFQGTKILSKFWSIKGLIALYMSQTLILAIINATDSVTATRYMSMADFTYGIFPFLICCETLLSSIVQIQTMSALQYRNVKAVASIGGSSQGHSKSDASIPRYLFTVCVPLDFFRGVWEALKFLVRLPLGRKSFDYTGGTGSGYKGRQGSESGRRLNGAYEMVADDEEPPEYRAPGRAPM